MACSRSRLVFPSSRIVVFCGDKSVEKGLPNVSTKSHFRVKFLKNALFDFYPFLRLR